MKIFFNYLPHTAQILCT